MTQLKEKYFCSYCEDTGLVWPTEVDNEQCPFCSDLDDFNPDMYYEEQIKL